MPFWQIVLAVLALCAFCVRVIAGALRRPRIEDFMPACGGCGFWVAASTGGLKKCPECGGDYREVGIYPPSRVKKRLYTLPVALTAWAIIVGAWTWWASMHMTEIGVRVLRKTVHVKCTYKTDDALERPARLPPYEAEIRCEGSYEVGRQFDSGSVTIVLQPTGKTKGTTVEATFDATTRYLDIQRGADLPFKASIDDETMRLLFEASGIQVNNDTVRLEVRMFTALLKEFLNSQGRSPLSTGEYAGHDGWPGLVPHSQMQSESSDGYYRLGNLRGAVVASAVYGVVISVPLVIGWGLIVWRYRKVHGAPSPRVSPAMA